MLTIVVSNICMNTPSRHPASASHAARVGVSGAVLDDTTGVVLAAIRLRPVSSRRVARAGSRPGRPLPA
ncbi:Uncharacterised protein [Mycobacteroides abscessus subsp. abscessus]|nr:Uncharacterised protein [Mycobacteroides abscessus subsp. abscessus]